jgi:hypothetical protein
MADDFLTINESVKFIRERYDPRMERVKLWSYSKQGWFDVVEYPGGRPRIKRQSIIDAYENPPPHSRYPYRGKVEETEGPVEQEVEPASAA